MENRKQAKNWQEGEYIVYRNGENYEIGRIKNLRDDGAFVAYHEGETGAKTPWDCIHKLQNAYVIKKTTLAWEYFDDAEIPTGERRNK